MNYEINISYPQLPVDERLIINTINPHSYCIAKKDHKFRDALKASDILLPDGTGIVYASSVLNKTDIPRITGSDIHLHLLAEAQRLGLKVFYLGSSDMVLQKIKERVNSEYPNIVVGVHSPPFKKEFNEEDNAAMIKAVNAFSPDILFVGMTAPKQEKWVAENASSLNAGIISSIGAVFDFYSGAVKRPGIFWQKLGLEWLPRLLRDPIRLWNRTFVSTPLFLLDVFKLKVTGNNGKGK